MHADNMSAEIYALVTEARNEVIDNLQRDSRIGPADWHVVDEIMSATLDELVHSYMRQLITLMQLIADADLDVPMKTQMSLLKMNVHSVMLTSVLSAHFDVIKETGRTARDAHLHLDRVKRSAERDQNVAVGVVSGKGGES